MATFSFNDEFVKCGAFKTTEIKSIEDSDFTRINNNSYYAPILTAKNASYDEGYILDDALASQIANNIRFTVSILPKLRDGVHVEGTIYYWLISALRVNNLYGGMGIYYWHYKGTDSASGFVIDSSLDWNNAGGITLDQYNNVTLIFIRLNNKIYPCKYTIDAKTLYVMYPPDGIPLYDDIIVRSKDEIENPYDQGGTSGPGGGDGLFDDGESEDIRGDIPNGSVESSSASTGLFTRYAMNPQNLYTLGAALYTENILAAIGKEIMSFLWNSPSDALISLISYPFDIGSLVSTTTSPIKFGSLPLEAVTGARLNETFAKIDWGSIYLEEFWGNFLDYAPHTKVELYLPWCTGFVSIDPHECLPGSISVVTNIELSKGTCVHNVFGNKGALIGMYSGTCGAQLPMTALDTSGKALALVTAAAGAIVAGAAGGGATSAGIAAANDVHSWGPIQRQLMAGGMDYTTAHLRAVNRAAEAAEAPYRAVKQRASQAALVSAAAAFRTPPSVQRSGSFSGNGAGMSIQYPFVIISRPEQNVPENYGSYYGYPSNVYTTLGSVRGYTEVGSVHVNGLSGATLDEIEEIENLLHGGVIL